MRGGTPAPRITASSAGTSMSPGGGAGGGQPWNAWHLKGQRWIQQHVGAARHIAAVIGMAQRQRRRVELEVPAALEQGFEDGGMQLRQVQHWHAAWIDEESKHGSSPYGVPPGRLMS